MSEIVFTGQSAAALQWLLPFLQALYQMMGCETRGAEQFLCLSRIPEGQQILFLQHQPLYRQELIIIGREGVNQNFHARCTARAIILSPL